MRAVEHLSIKQKEIINYYMEGRSMLEISRLMGHKNVNYTRVAKLRAKQKLEIYIKNHSI